MFIRLIHCCIIKNLWPFFLVPGRETLSPWSFPSHRSVFAIHGGSLNHTWVYADTLAHSGPPDISG